MFRRLSAAGALLALLAMGFVAPSLPPFQVGRTATVGGTGVAAPLASLGGRRLRAMVVAKGGGLDVSGSDVSLDGADHFGADRFGFARGWWLSTPTRPFVPDLVVGTVVLVAAPALAQSFAWTSRTSRGPPAFVTL